MKLAEQAQDTGDALGHKSDPAATLFPLPEKPATYPMEYEKRAGELIARGCFSQSGTTACRNCIADGPRGVGYGAPP